MIGDGMGFNQVRLAELYLQGTSSDKKQLSFSQFPVQTVMATHSQSSDVTDSAASGTALACGHKTANGVVSKDSTGNKNFESIATQLRGLGYKIGIATSVSIDHATPAVFYAHENSRHNYYQIAMALGQSGFDFFGGGGFHTPKPADSNAIDAYESAAKHGYQLVRSLKALSALPEETKKLFVMHPTLLGAGEMPWAMEAPYPALPLSEITQKGIEHLATPKGFFMMVEGGKIDWACHENDGAAAIHETLAFGDAVDAAIAFYKKHKSDTLIIVTADHETGGLSLGNNTTPMALKVARLQHQKLALGTLNATIATEIAKKASFDDILALITTHTGLGDSAKGLGLSELETEKLRNAYNHMVSGSGAKMGTTMAGGYSLSQLRQAQLGSLAIDMLNQKAGIGWRSLSHSAAKVPLYAIGVGQELFKKPLDNTDVPKLIKEAMGI